MLFLNMLDNSRYLERRGARIVAGRGAGGGILTAVAVCLVAVGCDGGDGARMFGGGTGGQVQFDSGTVAS
ncbi:MAG: hypothetical protein ABJA82_19525, partial [Myxococcales bacterium]